MRDNADDGRSAGADPRRWSDGLAIEVAVAWDVDDADDDDDEEERDAWGAFALDDAPDFNIPVDLTPPFLIALIPPPPVDDFLTLWVVVAPIDVILYYILFISFRR
jgi:hypothetical protein